MSGLRRWGRRALRVGAEYPLARRYFTLTLLIGALLTLLLTGVEAYTIYREQLDKREELLHRVQTFYAPYIATSLWVRDSEQIDSMIGAMVASEAIAMVTLEDRFSHWQSGDMGPQREADWVLMLEWPTAEGAVDLGELSVFYDWTRFRQSVWDTSLKLLGLNLLKAALLFGFSLMIFLSLINRRLVRISRHIQRLDPTRLSEPLPLDRPGGGVDEIDRLASSLNALDVRLCESNATIERYNAELEQRVDERTRALTEATELALEQERLAAIGKMAGSISHELRNPLGSVHASIALLKQQRAQFPAQTLGVFDRVARNVERCDRLLREMLAFANESLAVGAPIDLGAVIETVAREQRARLPAAVRLVVDVEPGLSVAVSEESMQRVLDNLINNARDAIGETGPGRIAIEARSMDCEVLLEVSDDGCGFEPGEAARLFEILYSRKTFGFGFGLSTVKQIVERHRGRVTATSDGAGTGARLSVRLPVATTG